MLANCIDFLRKLVEFIKKLSKSISSFRKPFLHSKIVPKSINCCPKEVGPKQFLVPIHNFENGGHLNDLEAMKNSSNFLRLKLKNISSGCALRQVFCMHFKAII